MDLSTSSNISCGASDAQLVHAARLGEKRAFVEIVARYQGTVCAVALGILGDFAASEDAAQEAFLTAWRKIGEVRQPEKLRAWLCQVARNAALAQLRQRRGGHESVESALTLADDSPFPDERAATDEEAELVRAALSNLPEQYRLPLVLFYREGQSVRLVAETLELSEDAVKQRLARGREMLRDRISGVIERVLTRTTPGPAFTITIASAIGALTAPGAVAGTVFAADSLLAGTAGSSTPMVALMSTSKGFVGVAALLTMLCIPAGYYFAPGGRDIELDEARSQAVPEPQRVKLPQLQFESALFREWRQLHEKYGTNSAAMPLLYKAISEIEDTLRQRAFYTALVSEWVMIDPAAGLPLVLKNPRHWRHPRQFVEEWLTLNSTEAVNTMLGMPGAEEMLHEYLPEIARRLPGRVAEVASRLPETESPYKSKVRDAFAVLAESNLEEARQTADAVRGPMRNDAFAGVAMVWAKRDLDAAITWSRELPESVEAADVVSAALLGAASVDPIAALERLELAPPGGRQFYANSTTAAQVLGAAAESDFDRTVSWLAEHPGKLTSKDITALSGAVTDRLNADTAGFLTRCSNEGSLGAILPAIRSALINVAAPRGEAVWKWLQGQPQSEAIAELRRHVMVSAAYHSSGFALKMANDIPAGAAGEAELQHLADALFAGGYDVYRFETLMEQAPEQLRPALVEQAFDSLGSQVEDPRVWIGRLPLLPEEKRARGIAEIASAWTMRYPEEAIEWVSSMAPGNVKNGAVAAMARSWSRNDPQSAAAWVKTLPAGSERDHGARSLVETVAQYYPEEAWTWSLSIADSEQRRQAAEQALRAMSQRNPAIAGRWIDAAPFAFEEKVRLREAVVPPVLKPGGQK